MFGISLQELMVLLIIGIIVIPPKEFPKLLKFGLDIYKKVQQLYTKILREINCLDI